MRSPLSLGIVNRDVPRLFTPLLVSGARGGVDNGVSADTVWKAYLTRRGQYHGPSEGFAFVLWLRSRFACNWTNDIFDIKIQHRPPPLQPTGRKRHLHIRRGLAAAHAVAQYHQARISRYSSDSGLHPFPNRAHYDSLADLVQTFSSHLSGIVLYDPRVPATSNLASTAAGTCVASPSRHEPVDLERERQTRDRHRGLAARVLPPGCLGKCVRTGHECPHPAEGGAEPDRHVRQLANTWSAAARSNNLNNCTDL